MQSLTSAIAVASSPDAAGQVVHITVGAGAHALVPTIFDGHITASAIYLTAASGITPSVSLPSTVGRRLQTAVASAQALVASALFTIVQGAPPVHMHGLHIAGPIAMQGGVLYVSNCTLAQRPLATSRVLQIGDGVVYAEDTRFEDNPAGAVAVTSGNLTLVNAIFARNAAHAGAAMHVSGGYVQVKGSVFEANNASVSGGALYINGGHVALTDRTLLTGNIAPYGGSIALAVPQALTYTLPAPLGRWIFAHQGATASIDVGTIDADYPYACNAGLVGNSYEASAQSGPLCANICPEGQFCDRASVETQPCPLGAYCPPGTSQPRRCNDGTYGSRIGLRTQDECTVCPRGAWCRDGLSNPCGKGTYNAQLGANDQAQCRPCPDYSSTQRVGAQDASACECVSGFYLHDMGPDASASGALVSNSSESATGSGVASVGNATSSNQTVGESQVAIAASQLCIPCPVGADCSAGAETLLRLKLKPGYYRVSSTSNDVRRCPDHGGPILNCSQGQCGGLTGVIDALQTTSGCLGGNDVVQQCRAGLEGPFCMLCERGALNASSTWYRPAGGSEPSECLDCGGLLVFRLAMTLLILIGILLVLRLVAAGCTRLAHKRPELYSRLVASWQRYQIANKVKHLIGFYQIASKIPNVYEVNVPADVQKLLSLVAVSRARSNSRSHARSVCRVSAGRAP